MPRYIKVTAQGQASDEITELPLEDDNSLPLADVTAQFPGAVGLKARVGENSTRAVKLRESLLYPLEASEDEETIFVVVQQTKRSRDEDPEEDTRSKASKLPQLELIVLGLPFEETQDGVKTYFEKYGEVSEVDIKTFPNGKSRGFCFVTFKDEDVVKQVAAEQHTIGGRSCTVKVPYKRDERAPYGQRGQGPPAQAVTKLFIGKLPETINETMLRACFSEFGALKDVYIPNRPFRGIAYVEFVERDGMDKALATTHTVDGVELNVSMATPRTYNPAYANGGAGGGGGRYNGYGNQGTSGYYQNQQQDGYRNQGNHGGYGQAQRGAHQQQWGGRGGWNGGAGEGQGGYARGAGIQQGGYGAGAGGGYTYHAQQQGGYQGGWNNGGAY